MRMMNRAVDLTQVDAPADYPSGQFPIGIVCEEDPSFPDPNVNPPLPESFGARRWRYVKTQDALAAGELVSLSAFAVDSGGWEGVEKAGANANVHRIAGIAQHAIGAGKFGWILTEGYGRVKGLTTATLNSPWKPSATAGQVTDTVTPPTDAAICWGYETPANDGDLVKCRVFSRHAV